MKNPVRAIVLITAAVLLAVTLGYLDHAHRAAREADGVRENR